MAHTAAPAPSAAADALIARVATGLVLFQKDTRAAGQWRLIGPADVVVPGRTVQVAKADGTTSTVFVASIARSGERNGTAYAIADFTNAYRPRAPRAPARFTSGTCEECGRHDRALELVHDSSGIPGYCCRRCVHLDPVERSFA